MRVLHQLLYQLKKFYCCIFAPQKYHLMNKQDIDISTNETDNEQTTTVDQENTTSTQHNESENVQETATETDVDAATERLQQELKEAKGKYLRLLADFDNYRKRTARERLDLIKTASSDLIVSLLPILDDFERAFKAIKEPSEDVKGFGLIQQKLHKTLEAKGLKAMESVGQEFDPDLHAALTKIPAPTEDLSGKVLDEVERGYYLNDKIIRHAKVIIGD